MAETPPQIVWRIYGSPSVGECEPASGRCYVCVGEMQRGMRVQPWLGSNYTDQNRARNPVATHVCEACCYVHAWNSPLGRPAAREGGRGMNMRMVGHFYEHKWRGAQAPGYLNANKGEKPAIRAFLQREHGGTWFAAIADSGQKHVLPFAPLNGRGRAGTVIMDELVIRVPSDVSLINEMMALLTAGATKEELDSGNYSPRAWELCGAALHSFEREHGLRRGGGWYTLALWLAQRDEEAAAARLAAQKETRANARREAKRAAAKPNRGASARATERIPEDPGVLAAKALGTTPGAAESGCADNDEPRGVGKQDATRPTDPKPGQLGIPGLG